MSRYADDATISGSIVVTGSATFNDQSKDVDFRVESDDEDEAFYLDASANTLYINKGATAFTTIIKNNNEEAIRVGASGVILNQYGHASNDFRVESDDNDHMLFVDAGNDRVGVGTSSPGQTLEVAGTLKVAGEDVRIKIDGDTDSHPGLEMGTKTARGSGLFLMIIVMIT